MEPLSNVTNPNSVVSNQDQCDSKENQELKLVEPKRKITNLSLVSYQGFNIPLDVLPNVKVFQQYFQPRDTDIILVTKPKSGTTWLKSLVYSIVHRTHFTNSNHPLLTKNPHELVPTFEFNIYSIERREKEQVSDVLTGMPSPRLFSTHVPYEILPELIKGQSKCKIVFMARNPFDTVVSYWSFMTRNFPWLKEEMSLEDFVESFCNGEEAFGPHWDHVLRYWKESLERPNKMLFLKYEDMQEDGISEMKKLAEFLGFGFSKEEEMKGVIHENLSLCSIDKLKNLEVNKTGTATYFKNDTYFRKGKVGDWVNHLNPSMVERLDQLTRDKFADFGLEFKRIIGSSS